ncbi:HAD family phosphatase [Arthrobacter sp. GMC3]|uniref:HAD family hydrolase n=1 Tax=Arthrobacter sp. GMC3 TaxID=2058894 RepID=UPI000CE33BAD|nr:HAD-IA family hydrolase [Arthrobacter sp. GMC3]
MTDNRTIDTASWRNASALLFDLDGVLTPTAALHERAWQTLFAGFLVSSGKGEEYRKRDYFDHIDGKPRFDGVRDFLTSRDINLPEGQEDDDPSYSTVRGLGNRKNLIFNATIETHGVVPYAGSVHFIHAAIAQGLKLAVVSSSRNAPAVLKAAGLDSYFPVVVDGALAAINGIPGKPDPATFDYAARLLGVPSKDCIIIEDAVSGVQAGRVGNFRAVIGVDRGAGRQTLLEAGATTVVNDLSELL